MMAQEPMCKMQIRAAGCCGHLECTERWNTLSLLSLSPFNCIKQLRNKYPIKRKKLVRKRRQFFKQSSFPSFLSLISSVQIFMAFGHTRSQAEIRKCTKDPAGVQQYWNWCVAGCRKQRSKSCLFCVRDDVYTDPGQGDPIPTCFVKTLCILHSLTRKMSKFKGFLCSYIFKFFSNCVLGT